MRWRFVTASALVGLSAACGGASSPGDSGLVGPPERGNVAASCVGPLLSITPKAAAAGDTVQAFGEWFAADCYDTGTKSGQPPPLTGMRLRVLQAGHSWTVASRVDASGSHFTFHVAFKVPDGIRPGQASVVVPGHSRPVRLRVSPN